MKNATLALLLLLMTAGCSTLPLKKEVATLQETIANKEVELLKAKELVRQQQAALLEKEAKLKEKDTKIEELRSKLKGFGVFE